MFTKFRDYVSDNHVLGNATEEEAKLRQISPDLLQQGEKVEFAFIGRGGSGRDSAFLTDRRMLVRDVKGMTGKRVSYRSTPYSSIKAWAVSTAGGGFDSDSEMQVMDSLSTGPRVAAILVARGLYQRISVEQVKGPNQVTPTCQAD